MPLPWSRPLSHLDHRPLSHLANPTGWVPPEGPFGLNQFSLWVPLPLQDVSSLKDFFETNLDLADPDALMGMVSAAAAAAAAAGLHFKSCMQYWQGMLACTWPAPLR